MGKVNVQIEIQAPITACYTYVKESVIAPRYLSIYRELHHGKHYSGKIVQDHALQHLVITEQGYDSMSKLRHKGWTISYAFEALGENSTKVEVTVAYGWFLALMGMTTTKIQAINEMMGRVSALLALENTA
ncbi:hypothetical protein [Rubritalea marina]|uniref:hypothetical protein n=1 Tax=Rubritalea marina TaxID=361055 RepID=UPI00037166DD|nr:hypothetical protein [Rubritalea marina]